MTATHYHAESAAGRTPSKPAESTAKRQLVRLISNEIALIEACLVPPHHARHRCARICAVVSLFLNRQVAPAGLGFLAGDYNSYRNRQRLNHSDDCPEQNDRIVWPFTSFSGAFPAGIMSGQRIEQRTLALLQMFASAPRAAGTELLTKPGCLAFREWSWQ